MFIVPDPDIEEDDDTCIVRIAPKPIKIKIKPLAPPIPDSPAAAAPIPSADSSSMSAASGPPTVVTAAATTPYMHPKKKMAHMDYLINNVGQENAGGGSRLSVSQSSASSNLPPVPAVENMESQTRATVAAPSLAAMPGTPLSRGKETHPAVDVAHSAQTPIRSRLDSGQERASGRPTRERNGPGGGAGSARKGGDLRTKCDVCLGEGSNADLVR